MKKRRVVIKIGSSVMTSKGRIDEKFLKGIVSQVGQLSKKNIVSCIVSSGAIVVGMTILGIDRVPTKIDKLQAIASIGQARLMNIYNTLFNIFLS